MTPAPFTVKTTGFEATVSVEAQTDPRVRVALRGNAENEARELLTQVLSRVDEAVADSRAVAVDVDFRSVDFMNSSCFKEFVTWLSRLKAPAPVSPVAPRVVFWSNNQVRWQRASLHALSCFASEVVEIKAS